MRPDNHMGQTMSVLSEGGEEVSIALANHSLDQLGPLIESDAVESMVVNFEKNRDREVVPTGCSIIGRSVQDSVNFGVSFRIKSDNLGAQSTALKLLGH